MLVLLEIVAWINLDQVRPMQGTGGSFSCGGQIGSAPEGMRIVVWISGLMGSSV